MKVKEDRGLKDLGGFKGLEFWIGLCGFEGEGSAINDVESGDSGSGPDTQ